MKAFRKISRYLLVLLSGLTLCQCGREDASKEEAPAVGVLRTTTHAFTLHAGPDGTLYTVRDKSGNELVRMVPADVLAAKYPDLSDDLKSLYAGNEILKSTHGTPDPGLKQIGKPVLDGKASETDVAPLPDLRP